jgi:hypothetical protein
VPGSLVGSDCPLPEKGFDVMHTSNVKVLRGPITFGGWKAKLTLDGDLMTMEGAAGRSLVVSLAEVREHPSTRTTACGHSACATVDGCGCSRRPATNPTG